MWSAAELQAFARDGYLVARGVVPAEAIAPALARIDRLLVERPPPAGHTGHHFYFEPAEAEPELVALLTGTPAGALAAALTAPLPLVPPAQVQVALTVPPSPHRPGRGHIDGMSPAEPDGRPGTFTLLAGVVLSDQTRDGMGNLFVWPGTHRQIAAHLRARGADAIHETGGYPPADHSNPVPVHAAPGDVIYAHYLLSHNTGGNTSEVLRRTAYFRLSTVGHAGRWREHVTDALHEFPALSHPGPATS